MKVLVMGSTGGSGSAAVEKLLAAGHEVTAFTRDAGRVATESDRLQVFVGDAMNPADVERAVDGHDAVVVTLGISENPLRVRFSGAAHTASDVRSAGTRNVIDAMKKEGVRRLVVQSSYGVGETRDRLRFIDRLFFTLLLSPQIADTEAQENEVRGSGLEWVIVQPVHLTDAEDDSRPAVSLEGETESWSVSRNSVGRFLAEAVEREEYVERNFTVSGANAA